MNATLLARSAAALLVLAAASAAAPKPTAAPASAAPVPAHPLRVSADGRQFNIPAFVHGSILYGSLNELSRGLAFKTYENAESGKIEVRIGEHDHGIVLDERVGPLARAERSLAGREPQEQDSEREPRATGRPGFGSCSRRFRAVIRVRKSSGSSSSRAQE